MAEQAVFDEHRGLLFRVAYDLLGSVADAEDVVQETWLRWSGVDHSQLLAPRAYLVKIVSRQALNRIRANRARRETYVRPWLPEPLVAPALVPPDPADEVADRAEREETISVAVLVVLETLSPPERAVFVLREVFGMSHDEVATALERSPASVRQLAHRAREHVQARRPRFTADDAEQRRVTQEFLQACLTGDLDALTGLLAPDITVLSDGGGKAKAALRPVVGADNAARFLIGIVAQAAQLSVRFALVNGTFGVVAYEDRTPSTVAVLDLGAGRVENVYIVRNPDKLAHVQVIDLSEAPP